MRLKTIKRIFVYCLLNIIFYSNNVFAVESDQVLKSLDINEPLDQIDFGQGVILDFTVGLGSGAFHYASDPDNIIYFITDRGPNINCLDDQKRLKKNLCETGKVFPTPDYAPRIYKLKLFTKSTAIFGEDYQILDMIEIKNNDNQPVSGMPNDLTVTDHESAYKLSGRPIKLDNNGIDTEALVRLSDGSFWVAEEYAPSLLHINPSGKIIERIVPKSVERDLQSARYRVTGKLPTVLRKRMLNRGIEGLALSRDEQYLYFILQSPLANPNKAAYKKSANVRLFKVKLSQGNFSKVIGEYLYQLDQPSTFGNTITGVGDLQQNKNGSFSALKQNKIKISEMTVLPSGELIVLERISKTTKLYKVDLTGSSNLLDSKYDDEATSPSLEQLHNPQSVGINVVNKKLVFNSMYEAPHLPRKVEGIASLESGQLLLINDNDFDGRVVIRASIVTLNISEETHTKVVARH